MKLLNRKGVHVGEVFIQYGFRPYTKPDGSEGVSPTYYIECGYAGKRFAQSLNTTSEATALARIHELAERIAAGHGQPPAKATIASVAAQYLQYQQSMSRARTTLTKYEYVLSSFIAWATHQFNRPIGKFAEADFWRWHRSLVQGYGKKTAYDHSVVIKQLFKWATNKAKILPTNPVSGATLSKPPPNEQPVFTPEQTATLLANADDQLRPIITTMAYAGLRFGEVRDLPWSLVSLPADGPGHLTIRYGGSADQTKTGTVRRIPIHPELRKVLETLPRTDERVFHAPVSKRNASGLIRLNEASTLKSLKRLCARCGLPNPQRFKLHTFRHTFASMLARSKVPIQYAQALMGHRSSGILALYYHLYDDTAVEAIAAIQYPAVRRTG